MLRDDTDRQIVALLQANARLPYPAIAERVALSPPAVKRRIDRLVADGTITAFTVAVDPAAVGATTEAFVEVFCSGRTSPAQLRALAESHPSVVAAYTVTGSADALFHLRCTSTEDLEATLEHIRAFDVVERTDSVIVLSRLVTRG